MFWQQFEVIETEMKQFESFLLANLDSKQPVLHNSISNLAQAGGKRIRPALIIATAYFGEYNRATVWPVAAAIEILHMATLVHDDIIDEAELRRGEEAVQSKYGKDTAVFAGDYLFSLTFDILAGTVDSERIKQVVDIIKKVCEGEIQQYQTRYQADISYKDYFKLVKQKTAVLFAECCLLGGQLGNLAEEKVKHLGRFGRYLGMAFQLTDDVLDFSEDKNQLGKLVTNDFTQGIYTLPILYVLRETNRGSQLEELLAFPQANQAEIKEMIAEQGGVDYALQVAEKYVRKAQTELKRLPANQYRDLLNKLAEKVVTRQF